MGFDRRLVSREAALRMTSEADDLVELKRLYARRKELTKEEGEEWVERVSQLLNRRAPAHASKFDDLTQWINAFR